MDRARVHAARALLFALLAGAAHAADEDGPPAQPAPPPPAPPVVDVGEVSVTATRAERSLLEVPGNVTVIDRSTIERSGARDVPELLRREAGLFVTNDTGNPEGYRVEARGFANGGGNGSSLLVLLDGRRLNEADSSFVDWSLLHLDRVERIEIVRGPASALYGDNAMAGVVHVITRRSEGEPEFDFRTRRASFDTELGSVYAGGSSGPLSATLFADGYDTDGFRERSDFRQSSLAGSLRWTPTDLASFEVSSGYSSDERKRPGTLESSEIEALGRDGADPATADNFDDARERWLQGAGELLLADDVALRLLPYWRSRSDDGAIATADAFSSSDFDFAIDTASWGGTSQLEIDRPLGELANRAVLGVEFLREDVERTSAFLADFGGFPFASSADGSFHRRVWSAFAHDELSLGDDVIASAGVRYDGSRYRGTNRVAGDFPEVQDLDDRFDEWSPRAALTWRFADPLSAYVSYARGFRFPNLDEALGFTGDLFDLDPQRSNAYEVGVKHRSTSLSANLALFWMEVKDEILFDHEINFPFDLDGDGVLDDPNPQNANLDRVRHRGVEAWTNWRPRSWLELYGSYTFDDTTIRHDSITDLDGERIPITPRHRGTLGALVAIPWRIELGANYNWVGSRTFANDLRNEFGRLGHYETLDVHVAWRPRLREGVELELLGRVRNCFDQEFSEFAGEGTFSRGVLGYNPSPDRSYEAGLALTWRP